MATRTAILHPARVDEAMTAQYPVLENPSYPFTNAVGKGSDNTTYAEWRIPTTKEYFGRVVYNFDTSIIPQDAVIIDISCTVKAHVSTTSNSVIGTRQIYIRSNYQGASPIFARCTLTDAVSELQMTCDLIPRERLNDIWLDCTTVRANKTTEIIERLYGVTLSITYTAEEILDELYVKESGQFKMVSEAYKKINGVWVLQNDISGLFSKNATPVLVDGSGSYYTDDYGNRFTDDSGNHFTGGQY